MKCNAKIINLKDRVISFDDAIRLEDILNQVKDELPYPVYLAKLDNAYRALTHITEHSCNIEFLDLRNQEAWLVYQNSLILIFIKAVHDLFGKKVLREVPQEEFMRKIGTPCPGVSEIAKLRAQHFYDENARVLKARQAIINHDQNSFLLSVSESGDSSRDFLHNTMVPGQYEHSPQQAVDIARRYIGKGAVRIMGGGFAGSIIAFVYPTDFDAFMAEMIGHYGKKNVKEVKILSGGPRRI